MLNLQYCAEWMYNRYQPISRVYPQKTGIATKLHVTYQCLGMPHRTLDAKDNKQNRTHLQQGKCSGMHGLATRCNVGNTWKTCKMGNHMRKAIKCTYFESIWIDYQVLWLMAGDFTACLGVVPYDGRSPVTTVPTTDCCGTILELSETMSDSKPGDTAFKIRHHTMGDSCYCLV